jgi:hypothetical protein
MVADTYATAAESPQSAVSWAAIICGAVVAAAVSLILLALGSALNLASISAWTGRGVSGTTFTAMTAIWFIVIQWIASGVGGYLTGRMRTKWVSIHTHEVFFRDTAHGFVTWALATLLTVGLFASVAASWVSGGAHAAEALAPAASQGTTTAVGGYDLDVLLRGSRADTNATSADPRAEIARVVANGLTGNGIPPADRTYLASLVAARTGISQSEAEQRVDTLITRSKDTLDKIRKATSAAAFFTALSLLIGAFIACTAAALGGRWRDAPVPSTS